MPYGFNFDLSGLSRSFFMEIAKIAGESKMHRRIGKKARYLLKKFRIHEITGLNISEALLVIEDLIDVHIENLSKRQNFLRTNNRALLLPHCSRKYMDKRCKATFDVKRSSYRCAQCSSDCPINLATKMAEERGYDVYVLPGSSCVTEILQRNRYEGVVGVACCEELKLGINRLKRAGLMGQGIPLIKNGCANTEFNMKSLEELL